MRTDLGDEAREIIDDYFKTDFQNWLGEELKKVSEKTDQIAQVIINVRWDAPVWKQNYETNKREQYLAHETQSFKTFFDVIKEDGIGIKMKGDSFEIPEKPLYNLKFSLLPLWNAESFNMNITASTLNKNNSIINTKEWTYTRKADEKPKGCISEGEAVLDEFESKDLEEWLTALTTAEKTDQVAKVVLQFKWIPKVWDDKYFLDLTEKNSSRVWHTKRVLIDDTCDWYDDEIEFYIQGTKALSGLEVKEDSLKKSDESPIQTYKEDLDLYLEDAVSFMLKVQGTAYSANNTILSSKEWTYKRPA